MIVGLGTDIVSIARIRDLLEKQGEAFLQRVFTPAELLKADSKRDPAEFYASRWAAKEAASKALGCGIGLRCRFRDICVSNGQSGRPQIKFSGAGAETAAALQVENIHVSLSHEREHAMATVILEN
ncbi:holo-ACP synthase [Lentisphaerota bacterium ZTH]|nr:holo-ACP synthase [Lentisphaerota bacterium]WET06304.1 holo-ACP synthase [Lentisphaerota bacterium ZTH]